MLWRASTTIITPNAEAGLVAGGRLYLIAKCKHLKVLDFRKVKLKVRFSVCPVALAYIRLRHSFTAQLLESTSLVFKSCMQAKLYCLPDRSPMA